MATAHHGDDGPAAAPPHYMYTRTGGTYTTARVGAACPWLQPYNPTISTALQLYNRPSRRCVPMASASSVANQKAMRVALRRALLGSRARPSLGARLGAV